MLKNKIFIVLCILGIGVLGCTGDDKPAVDCTGLTPTYTADVAPLLVTCATDGCHGNIATMAEVNLTTYDNVKKSTENSKFLPAIKHQSGAESMPPAGFDKLTDAQIKIIECWIKNGKPQ